MNRSSTAKSIPDRALDASFYGISFMFAVMCLLPFVLVIISSFTDEATLVRNGYSFFPDKWSADAYKAILASGTILNAYKVSIFVTVVGSALSLIVTSMGAYALSSTKLRYRNGLAFYFYFTLLFSGGLVPVYILISKYLHLKDSIWVYIIPVMLNPWNMLLLRNFFSDIPVSLKEAAYIEGANEGIVLTKIVLPLSLPALSTITLFYALAYWNSWLEAVLYISDEKLFSLQYLIMKIIRNISAATQLASQKSGASYVPPSYTIRLATAIVTIGPIIFVYPWLQKYFVSGLKVGGVKG